MLAMLAAEMFFKRKGDEVGDVIVAGIAIFVMDMPAIRDWSALRLPYVAMEEAVSLVAAATPVTLVVGVIPDVAIDDKGPFRLPAGSPAMTGGA
jgi:hypothetical protein